MKCAHVQEWMVEALYGELEAERRAAFDAHLGGCASCTALFGEMRATASLMKQHRRPDPGEAYWETYYERLQARLRAEPVAFDAVRVAARRRSYVSWGYRVAAAVAVLAAGVWLGRGALGPDAPPLDERVATAPDTRSAPGGGVAGTDSSREEAEVAIAPDSGRRPPVDEPHGPIDAAPGAEETPRAEGGGAPVVLASADARARRYVERSQILLLALVNAEPGAENGDAMLGEQRARAGALVREASGLRDELGGDEDRRLRELVGQLQMILREIANLENENDLDAVEIIRNRVSREGVLLQINVEQMRSARPDEPEPQRTDPID
jgi:hypothetical protein